MAIGTLMGHARVHPDMVVLWIDAHADINTPLTSDSGNIHGMPLSFVANELDPYVPHMPGWEEIQPWLVQTTFHIPRTTDMILNMNLVLFVIID